MWTNAQISDQFSVLFFFVCFSPSFFYMGNCLKLETASVCNSYLNSLGCLLMSCFVFIYCTQVNKTNFFWPSLLFPAWWSCWNHLAASLRWWHDGIPWLPSCVYIRGLPSLQFNIFLSASVRSPYPSSSHNSETYRWHPPSKHATKISHLLIIYMEC